MFFDVLFVHHSLKTVTVEETRYGLVGNKFVSSAVVSFPWQVVFFLGGIRGV